jgi:hypothetical protein
MRLELLHSRSAREDTSCWAIGIDSTRYRFVMPEDAAGDLRLTSRAVHAMLEPHGISLIVSLHARGLR